MKADLPLVEEPLKGCDDTANTETADAERDRRAWEAWVTLNQAAARQAKKFPSRRRGRPATTRRAR